MSEKSNIRPNFIENPAVKNRDGQFIAIIVNVSEVIKSWRLSRFSFEWLDNKGSIRKINDLSEKELPKRQEVEQKLLDGTPVEKPVLGIGITDNVEIGSGRAEFLTLAAHGVKTIPVHIPKSNESDFKPFIADVNS